MNFGPFWVKLGVSDVIKRVNILKCRNFDDNIVFFVQEHLPIPIFITPKWFSGPTETIIFYFFYKKPKIYNFAGS